MYMKIFLSSSNCSSYVGGWRYELTCPFVDVCSDNYIERSCFQACDPDYVVIPS